MAAKSTGDNDLLKVLKTQSDAFQQDFTACVDSGFGANQVFDVDLGQNDVLVDDRFFLSGEDILITIRPASDTIRGKVPPELPVLVDHPRLQKLRHGINQARAADPMGFDRPIVRIIGSKVRELMLTSSIARALPSSRI